MMAVRVKKLSLLLCVLTVPSSSAMALSVAWNVSSEEHCMVSLQTNARNTYWTDSGLENSMPISASLGKTICRDISIKYPPLWVPPVRRPMLGCFGGDCGGRFALHPIKTVTETPVHVPDGDNQITLVIFATAVLGLAFWYRQRRLAS